MPSTEIPERPIEDESKQSEQITIRESSISEAKPSIPEPGLGDFIVSNQSIMGHIALGPRYHIRRR